MQTYARIDNGVVMEIIMPMTDDDEHEVRVTDRFTPSIVETLVDMTNVTPQPACWWAYTNGTFEPPLTSAGGVGANGGDGVVVVRY